MPHTTRKKKSAHTKRLEVAGDDGWTRVTTTNPNQRAPRELLNESELIKQHGPVDSSDQSPSDTSRPNEVRQGMTIGKLQERYKVIEKRWLESQSWVGLKEAIGSEIRRNHTKIDNCVVFGTGSPSGSRYVWIMRQDVSLYQIAVMKAIVDDIEYLTGSRPAAFAQEPAYTSLDMELLAGLQIATVDSPEGFHLITSESLVYLAYAELNVELQAYAANPAVALTCKLDYYWRNVTGQPCSSRRTLADGAVNNNQKDKTTSKAKLDNTVETSHQEDTLPQLELECRLLERFKEDKGEVKLPGLEAKDYPFTNQYLYWRIAKDVAV